ncbi:hypothetical protein [Shouchella shacheensis]|uniref:hypothetical protein n=1 Tax=Shouchella shacheensis TaxID=1649580 RepID=UPI000740045E|nr:hypothetical protein [Shouchella shacheensis]
MKKTIAPLMLIGAAGATWYSMSDRKTKKKVQQFIEPIVEADMKLMNARTWKKAKKRARKMFA